MVLEGVHVVVWVVVFAVFAFPDITRNWHIYFQLICYQYLDERYVVSAKCYDVVVQVSPPDDLLELFHFVRLAHHGMTNILEPHWVIVVSYQATPCRWFQIGSSTQDL